MNNNNNKRSFIIIESDTEEEIACVELEIKALRSALNKKYKKLAKLNKKRFRKQVEEECMEKYRRETRFFPELSEELPKYRTTYTPLSRRGTNSTVHLSDVVSDSENEGVLKYNASELLKKCLNDVE